MKLKRIHEIENYVNEKGTVSLTELSKRFDVSMNTIRRDVNYLEENGVINKVYGGVTSTNGQQLTSYNFRNTKNNEAKDKIGELAASEVEEGDFIFIDSGTTTSQMLNYIDSNLKFTILTNNLDVIIEASQNENISLIILGTRYYPETRSFISTSIKKNNIDNYNVSKAFMAATAVSIKNGLTNTDFHEHEIKQFITSEASKTYILADSSKFGNSTLITYADLKDVDTIVTEKHLDQDIENYCEESNITIKYPSSVKS